MSDSPAQPKLLFVSSRFPQPGSRGDESRAYSFLKHLSTRFEVQVLTSHAPSTPAALTRLEALADVRVVPSRRLARAAAAVWALMLGQPAQVGWMMPRRAWREAQCLAIGTDVVLVNTARSLRGPIGEALVVDYVDAVSWNMAIRADGPERLPIRLLARFESWRMKRWESRVAGWSQGALATSQEVAHQLPDRPRVHVVPVPWDSPEPDLDGSEPRDIDVIFTGDMKYPPNREGAVMLAQEIVPRVRAERPDTSFWVVGRFASRLDVDGVHVASDVPDVGAYLRRAKVAVAPVRGKGSPYKVLEAAGNGAAVVAFPWAVESYELEAETAEDSADFVAAILRLLGSEQLRRSRVEQGMAAARAHSLEALGPRLDLPIAEALDT